jgi:hypothetical protein
MVGQEESTFIRSVLGGRQDQAWLGLKHRESTVCPGTVIAILQLALQSQKLRRQVQRVREGKSIRGYPLPRHTETQ